jgi:hypothetical protein
MVRVDAADAAEPSNEPSLGFYDAHAAGHGLSTGEKFLNKIVKAASSFEPYLVVKHRPVASQVELVGRTPVARPEDFDENRDLKFHEVLTLPNRGVVYTARYQGESAVLRRSRRRGATNSASGCRRTPSRGRQMSCCWCGCDSVHLVRIVA